MRGRALLVILSIALLVLQNASAQQTSPSAEHILFYDDFEDGDLAGWILSNSLDAAGVLEREGNHVLHISGEQDTYVSLGFRGSQQWDADVLEARVMFVTDTISRDRVLNFNLLGNAQGERGYSALISPRPAGAFFADRKDGFEMMESSLYNPFQIQYNEWHFIRLEISHDLMTLLIDSVIVAQTQIDANRHGSPSLTVGPHMELYVDDVYVLSEDVPTANTTAVQASLPEGSSLSSQSVLFYDDFEDGDLRGWTNSAQVGEIIMDEDGNHVLRLTGAAWSGIQVGDQTWTDYVVEARIKIIQFTDGPTPSMFYYVRDSDGNNYNAGLGPNGVGMGLNFNGEYSGFPATYASGMPFIQTNVWHIFRFQVFGDQLKLYFDGQLIAEYTVTENRLDHGLVSLVIAPNAEFYFDDVYVLSADVPTGLEPPTFVFEFDNTSAACDFTALPAPSDEILTGTALRELNVRSDPNTDASAITFLNEGELITFTNQAPLGTQVTMRVPYTSMGETLSQLTSHQWLGVEVERNGTIRNGYVWRFAVQPNPPSQPFINPYDACVPQTNTTGWKEILQREIGENWSNFISSGNAYYYPSANSIFLVLDGIWIKQPIPLYDRENTLLGIALLSTRGYYLDARGDLQSLIMPIYIQTDSNEVRGPYLFSGTIPLSAAMSQIERMEPPPRGQVVYVSLIEDNEAMINYRGRNNFDSVSLETIALYERYQQSHEAEYARLLFAGDPGVGVIWSDGNHIESPLPVLDLPNNE
jgi:hypothetical protein